MSSPADRYKRADELFDAALDLAPDQQAAFVERACGADVEMRAEVLRLLRAHHRSEFFFRSPALQFATPLLESDDALRTVAAFAPERVGNFRIVGVLGRGGMGDVFLAERDDGQFEQRVALKVIQHGATGLVQRFLEERRILALLEHPAIARLIDGGITPTGLPYFAMELVDGEPIDKYCDAHKLSLERRLELFADVCDAVTYAHQHLVIHRDLKPSNIIVTHAGQVKLLDFGIAKLVSEQALSADAIRTQFQAMTPEFAAPEQLRGEPVSTATDVYALGVLLHMLLTGKRPYDVSGKSAAELERIVCEHEPAKPSSRATDALRRRLRGDLDAIMMTALHKEKARRYQSTAELKLELARFLEGRPVAARPDGAGYRARKYIWRHRIGLAAAATIATLLITYVATVLIDRRHIQRALAEAQAGTRKAEQVTDFMLGLFQAAEGGKALTDSVTAQALLSRGSIEAHELTAQPELQAQMFDVIGRLHTQLGDYQEAQPLLEKALQIRRNLYGEVHPDVVTSMASLADVVRNKGNNEQAIELRRNVLDFRRRLAGDDDPKTIDALHALASALHGSGRSADAEPLFDEWLARLALPAPEVSAWRADQLSAAATFVQYRGELERAESMHREALAIRRSLFGERHHLVAVSLIDLGVLLDQTQRRDEAEPLLRRAVEILKGTYPDGHPQLAGALKSYGIVLEHLQRFSEAQEPLRAALEMQRRYAGPNSIDVAVVERDLAYALIMTGSYEEAEAISRDAVRILRSELGNDNSTVVNAETHLGDALRGQGRYSEAEPLLLAAYQRFETPKPVTAQWRRYALAALIRLYEAKAQPTEAAKYRALLTASLPATGAQPAQRPTTNH